MKPLVFCAGLSTLPAGLVLLHLGLPLSARGLWLPAGVAAFTLVWAWLAVPRFARIGLRAGWLVAWVACVHLGLWLPFLTASYLHGHGAGEVLYALSAGSFTAAAVGWYVLADWLWPTLATGGFLIALLTLYRRNCP